MTTVAEGKSGAWGGPLAAVILLQAAAAFLLHALPTTAPALTSLHGWSESAIGYLMAATMGSAIVCMLGSSGLVGRFGAVRTVQVGLVLGMAGVVLLLVPFWLAPVATALLIGAGYGPATPAGSDVLHRFSPPRHRALIFSVKQAGVPLGGAAAGLILPWMVTTRGWPAVVAVAVAVPLAAILIAQIFRSRTDGSPSAGPARVPTHGRARLLAPFASLQLGVGLPLLASVGGCLAVAQGILNAFLVSYLVSGLRFDLHAAGIVFAAMQVGGIVGRLAFGWLADRLGSGVPVVRIAAAGSVAAALILSVAEPGWGLAALGSLGMAIGVVGAGWNGVQLSEIARRSPPGAISETAAGATAFVFAGLVVGPAGFGLALAQVGSFPPVLAGLAVVPAVALALSFAVPRAP